MIANPTLKQQRDIMNHEMTEWLTEAFKKNLGVNVVTLKDIRFINGIDLYAQYDKCMMVVDQVRVIGVLLQFADYNALVHDSEDFKGVDEIVLQSISITLQSQLNEKNDYMLTLSSNKKSELSYSSVSTFDDFSLNCAHHFVG
jgi:hypothetical protein